MPHPSNLAPPGVPFATLADVLRHHAALRPTAAAVRYEGADTDYAQLAAQADRLAQYLHASGVEPGQRVAWLGFNHPLQLALLFALAQCGAIGVPLNYRLAPPEWDSVMADCTPCLLVSDAHWADAASSLAARAGVAHRQLEALAAMAPLPAEVQPREGLDGRVLADAPVLLVYTSGTTGRPKGALHTQGNLLANMALAQSAMALQAADLVATVLPLFHVGGLCIQTLPALYAGASVLLHARFDAAATLACIAQERPTLTLQVPATLRALTEHPQWPTTDLSSLRAVWAGSSVIPPHLVQALHARDIPLCNVYGSTETGPFSIALGPAHAASHLGSCGWPARAQGLVVQARLEPLTGQAGGHTDPAVGELCIRAPNVAACYWQAQSSLDAQGYFHTGDLARRAADGSYTVVGRAKDMLISGGENIYPAEIENLLVGHPALADCAVIGLPDAQWGEVVVACVVLRARQEGDNDAVAQELAAFLAGKIARYKLPRRWVMVQALPKTALGKVQKAQLASLVAALPLA